MIKTVKGKVIAGVMAVALVSGGGAALGATDAGAGLKSWYDSQFKKSEQTIAKDTLQHSAAGFSVFAENVKGLKSDATTGINETRDEKTNEAKTSIDNEGKAYVKSVQDKKGEIDENIEKQFEKIESLAKQTLGVTGQAALRLAEFDLKRHTGKEGEAALAHLKDGIEQQTKDSIDEIELEIRNAKIDLRVQLDSKSGDTIATINDLVDAKIAEILETITYKTGNLVQAQKDAIIASAINLEKDAKDKLDEAVISVIKE